MSHQTLRVVVGLLLLSGTAQAQTKVGTTGMTFLRTPAGARAWGMGGTGAAVMDPFVGHFNPGGTGAYALTGPIGFARNSQGWGPHSVSLTYSNTVVLASLAIPEHTRLSLPVSLAIGLAYHRQANEMAPTGFAGFGDTLYFQESDRSSNFTISAGVEHGIELGVGITLKSVKSVTSSWTPGTPRTSVSGSATAHDIGVYGRIPISQTLSRLRCTSEPFHIGRFRPELVLALSYAWDNRGHDFPFTDQFGTTEMVSLPRVNLLGRGLEFSMTYRHAPVAGFLAGRDDETEGLGSENRHAEGWEADLLGIVQVRGGRFWYNDNSKKAHTRGASVHLNGVTRWALLLARGDYDAAVPWYLRNWDIYYNWAKITDNSPLEGTRLREFGVTLKTEFF